MDKRKRRTPAWHSDYITDLNNFSVTALVTTQRLPGKKKIESKRVKPNFAEDEARMRATAIALECKFSHLLTEKWKGDYLSEENVLNKNTDIKVDELSSEAVEKESWEKFYIAHPDALEPFNGFDAQCALQLISEMYNSTQPINICEVGHGTWPLIVAENKNLNISKYYGVEICKSASLVAVDNHAILNSLINDEKCFFYLALDYQYFDSNDQFRGIQYLGKPNKIIINQFDIIIGKSILDYFCSR